MRLLCVVDDFELVVYWCSVLLVHSYCISIDAVFPVASSLGEICMDDIMHE